MTQEQIEGNKIIAEFMGAEEQFDQVRVGSIGTAPMPTLKLFFRSNQRFPDLMYTCKVDDLKYNSSWDWIMPAVNKFFNEIIPPSNQMERLQYINYSYKLYGFVTDFNITGAFICLAEAIQWYNQNKQK